MKLHGEETQYSAKNKLDSEMAFLATQRAALETRLLYNQETWESSWI
jgi:hypothetical protein